MMSKIQFTMPIEVGGNLVFEDWEMFAVLRRKWNLRQEDVAQAAGTHQSVLSAWERGRAQLDDEKAHELWRCLKTMIAAAQEENVA